MRKEALRNWKIPGSVTQWRRKHILGTIEALKHFNDPRWCKVGEALGTLEISEVEEVIRMLRPDQGRPPGTGKGKRDYDDEPHAREFETLTANLKDKKAVSETRKLIVSRMGGRGKGGKGTDDASKERRLRRARADLKADRTRADEK